VDGIACSAYTTDHDDFNTAGGLSPAILPNDPHRVAALMAYDILDSEPEQGIVMGLILQSAYNLINLWCTIKDLGCCDFL